MTNIYRINIKKYDEKNEINGDYHGQIIRDEDGWFEGLMLRSMDDEPTFIYGIFLPKKGITIYDQGLINIYRYRSVVQEKSDDFDGVADLLNDNGATIPKLSPYFSLSVRESSLSKEDEEKLRFIIGENKQNKTHYNNMISDRERNIALEMRYFNANEDDFPKKRVLKLSRS